MPSPPWHGTVATRRWPEGLVGAARRHLCPPLQKRRSARFGFGIRLITDTDARGSRCPKWPARASLSLFPGPARSSPACRSPDLFPGSSGALSPPHCQRRSPGRCAIARRMASPVPHVTSLSIMRERAPGLEWWCGACGCAGVSTAQGPFRWTVASPESLRRPR